MSRAVSVRTTFVLGYQKGETNRETLEMEKGLRLCNLNP